MSVEFDPIKAKLNKRKHGIGFAEADQALLDPMAYTVEDPDAQGEPRIISLGEDALGRVLVVVHTQRGERTRLISARKASRKEAS